jgi:putative Holliday junction resolvase
VKTLLCFDYGSKRIGVAVGQAITGTATPLQIINVYNNQPEWDRIQQMIKDWQPQALIVGIPIQMDDARQEMTAAAERFVRQLEGRFHLPVFGVDERLSTFEAKNRSGMETEIDSIAAQAILETWLTENNEQFETMQIDNNNE